MYWRIRTKMALNYLLGVKLCASRFLLFAFRFRRSARIISEMMISRAQTPPIKAANCAVESPLPDSGEFLKLVSLLVSESVTKIKVNNT